MRRHHRRIGFRHDQRPDRRRTYRSGAHLDRAHDQRADRIARSRRRRRRCNGARGMRRGHRRRRGCLDRLLRTRVGELHGAHRRRRFRDHRRGAAGRRLNDVALDQLAHARVARAARGAAEHDGDDMAPVAVNRGDQIEAGVVGVAGLDAVHALHAAEQMVVVAHRHAAVAEARQREIMVVLREALLDRAAEDRLIARGGELVGARQSRRVDIDRARHAERVRLARHQPAEVVLAAADRLGDHDRGVVRRLRDHALDRVVDRDRLPGLELELGGRLRGRVRGYRQARVELELAGFELLEQQVERHDLGDGGRVAQRVGVRRVQHLAGIGVDHDVGIGRGVAAVRGMGAVAAAVPAARVGVVTHDRDRHGHGGQGDNFSANPARRPVDRAAHVFPVPHARACNDSARRPCCCPDPTRKCRRQRTRSIGASPVVRHAVRETSPSAVRAAFWRETRSPTLGRRGCQTVKQPRVFWAGQYGANMSIALQKAS